MENSRSRKDWDISNLAKTSNKLERFIAYETEEKEMINVSVFMPDMPDSSLMLAKYLNWFYESEDVEEAHKWAFNVSQWVHVCLCFQNEPGVQVVRNSIYQIFDLNLLDFHWKSSSSNWK